MAKKLIDIQRSIESKNIQFLEYFYSNINSEIQSFIFHLMEQTNVYIFSGIIRDFFLSNENVFFRDIDIIIEDDLVLESLFNDLKYVKNSFGGYKIKFDTINVDLWVIKKTWALNQGQLKFEFDYLNELPNTTFFNFSSIIYSLNHKKYIIGTDFLKFLRDKKIELVLEKNPYPELCIVNSFYYADKLKLKIGNKLKSYLISNYDKNENNYEVIQQKHFGKIIYSKDSLEKRIESINTYK